MNNFERVIDGGGDQPKRYVLVGERGAIQFIYLEAREGRSRPMAFDLGYHSPHPMYDGQKPISTDCRFVNGGTCYYDGTSLGAEYPLRLLMYLGEEALWEHLARVYRDRFENNEVREEE